MLRSVGGAIGSAASIALLGAATRQALLDAARALFGEHGYEGTTRREIGVRAGADPALIARYFGSKADRCSQAMVAETVDVPPTETFRSFDATVA